MKKLKLFVPVAVATACAMFAGCKKSASSTSGSDAISYEPAGPVEFKINWQVGKRYDEHLTLVRTNYIQMSSSQKPRPKRSDNTEEFAISAVSALPDGGKKLEFTITREKFDGMGLTELSFDTNQDPQKDGNNPSAGIRQLIGAKFTCELDANGNASDLSGIDEFFAQLRTKDPQILGVMKELLNGDLLRQRVMQQQDLPKTPIKVGDHWTVIRDVPGGTVGTLLMNGKYTFKGWHEHNGHKCALMEFASDFSTKPGTSPHGMFTISVEKGEMIGSAWLNMDLQAMEGSAADQKMTLKIEAQGRTLSSEMVQRIDTKLLGVSDLAK